MKAASDLMPLVDAITSAPKGSEEREQAVEALAQAIRQLHQGRAETRDFKKAQGADE